MLIDFSGLLEWEQQGGFGPQCVTKVLEIPSQRNNFKITEYVLMGYKCRICNRALHDILFLVLHYI